MRTISLEEKWRGLAYPRPCSTSKSNPVAALSMLSSARFVVELERTSRKNELGSFAMHSRRSGRQRGVFFSCAHRRSNRHLSPCHPLPFPPLNNRWPPLAGSGTRNTPCRSAPREEAESSSPRLKRGKKKATPFLTLFLFNSSGRFSSVLFILVGLLVPLSA